MKNLLQNESSHASPVTIKTRRVKLTSIQRPSIQAKLRVSNMGAGMLYGDDDIVANRKHHATLTCVSGNGTLYFMPRDSFMNLFKINNETWNNQLKLLRVRELDEKETKNATEKAI